VAPPGTQPCPSSCSPTNASPSRLSPSVPARWPAPAASARRRPGLLAVLLPLVPPLRFRPLSPLLPLSPGVSWRGERGNGRSADKEGAGEGARAGRTGRRAGGGPGAPGGARGRGRRGEGRTGALGGAGRGPGDQDEEGPGPGELPSTAGSPSLPANRRTGWRRPPSPGPRQGPSAVGREARKYPEGGSASLSVPASFQRYRPRD
jgi:hypothetical protein